MTIRFIRQHDDYSVYQRPDGEKIYLAHGFPRSTYLFDFEDAWMLVQWGERKQHGQSEFLDWLREWLFDPDIVDDVRFCKTCGDPQHFEEGFTVDGDDFACQECICDYTKCADCDDYFSNPSRMTLTLLDERVCRDCRANSYTYCQNCDGYYHDDSPDDHDHDDDDDDDEEDEDDDRYCTCAAPAQTFHVRNDGEGWLRNDTQVTVTLPAGTLDSEGIDHIRRYLADEGLHDLAYFVQGMDRRWQTKEGNFTKRLSRAAYQKYSTKIPPAVLSQVGNIAQAHARAVNFTIATTRELNMSASDFYHSDSCWWTSYAGSRCALKSNGGFGLRSFNDNGYVSGRAWVMPLRMRREQIGECLVDRGLVPTFNTETPDAFVVFNAYGDLDGYNAARIVSHMAGMTYRKVTLSCDPMYINNDSGYVVAPEEIAGNFTDGSLYLNVSKHAALFDHENTAAKELVNV